jgi:hypothetical protein
MRTKKFLSLLFGAIFLWMVGMTITVGLQKPLWQAGSEFSWKNSPWAVATLFDAYFGFVTFFVWVCFKEATWLSRVVWFALIMTFGNIAMSGYLLLQLHQLKIDEPLANLLMRTKR